MWLSKGALYISHRFGPQNAEFSKAAQTDKSTLKRVISKLTSPWDFKLQRKIKTSNFFLTKKVLFKVLLSPCLSLQQRKQHWAFSEVKHEVAALWWFCLRVTAHTEKKRSHLVHGAAQLSRRHADDDSSRLQSGNLLLGTPFASGNDGSCVPHSPSRRSRQASNEWHHWLSIGTLKNEQKKQMTS